MKKMNDNIWSQREFWHNNDGIVGKRRNAKCGEGGREGSNLINQYLYNKVIWNSIWEKIKSIGGDSERAMAMSTVMVLTELMRGRGPYRGRGSMLRSNLACKAIISSIMWIVCNFIVWELWEKLRMVSACYSEAAVTNT